MTNVHKTNLTLIDSVAQARALYAAPSSEVAGRIGIEVEMPLYRPGTEEGLSIPTAAELTALSAALSAQGYDAQTEASGVLEYASPPFLLGAFSRAARKIALDLSAFSKAARKEGLYIAPHSVLPTTTVANAQRNMVSRERLRVGLSKIPLLYGADVLKIPLLTAGVQVSFSPRDTDEMFRMMRRAYALTPLIIASMNSDTGYAENDPVRKPVHLRGSYYDLYGAAGGVADSYAGARDAETLIAGHIQAVFDNKMYFAYALDGSLLPSTEADILTFKSLAARGLNTQANYELAESFLYNDVKICNLRDAEGRTVGKRLEVRAADSGAHQPVSMLLLAGTLIPDGPGAQAFERLLTQYGFMGPSLEEAALLRASRRAAIDHGGAFMNVAYGTGEMRDFAREVAKILKAHGPAGPESERLRHILVTGECDAQVTAREAPGLDQVVHRLRRAALVR